MKKILLATIALTALSSGSLMAFCTKGLPADAAAELAKGAGSKVTEFKRCYQKAVDEKAAGKPASDPNFVAAAVAEMKKNKALAQHVGYH